MLNSTPQICNFSLLMPTLLLFPDLFPQKQSKQFQRWRRDWRPIKCIQKAAQYMWSLYRPQLMVKTFLPYEYIELINEALLIVFILSFESEQWLHQLATACTIGQISFQISLPKSSWFLDKHCRWETKRRIVLVLPD